MSDFKKFDDPEPGQTPDNLNGDYLFENMITTLANYDVTREQWVIDNCRIIDYIKLKCYKNYEAYCQRISSKKVNNV